MAVTVAVAYNGTRNPLVVSRHSVYYKNPWEMPHSWRRHGLCSWFGYMRPPGVTGIFLLLGEFA